ncbi:MAG: hypothetical protein Ct9H90mP6_07380 [Gammaproteobacteria bacterium]|nr:MAG: hypothetical protein Ct9H90mP6_07380 [Gammaproteobacteria bacterium]
MNRYILQAFKFIGIRTSYNLGWEYFIVVLPIILSGMTYNAFNYNRMKEFYIFLVLTFVSILIALSLLGVL